MSQDCIEILKVILSFSAVLDSILMGVAIFLLGYALQIRLASAARAEIKTQAYYVFTLFWLSLLVTILSFAAIATGNTCLYYAVVAILGILLLAFLLYSLVLFRRIRR